VADVTFLLSASCTEEAASWFIQLSLAEPESLCDLEFGQQAGLLPMATGTASRLSLA
jgi:hypothetical protein